VIVAGVGCRSGCSADDVLAALRAALVASERAPAELHALFAPESKRAEPGLMAAAAQLGTPLLALTNDALQLQARATLTSSTYALRHFGVGSVAEAAALAGACSLSAGRARLLGPRCIAGGATCALAIGRETSGGADE
jgi:cobalt-precorrin 5A hydrolase